MERTRFKTTLLSVLFLLSLALCSCSSSNKVVSGTLLDAYCRNGSHLYGPDSSNNAILLDYNSDNGQYNTLLDYSGDESTTFESSFCYDGYLYCSVTQNQGQKSALVKVNLNTKEATEVDMPFGSYYSTNVKTAAMWKSENDIYYVAEYIESDCQESYPHRKEGIFRLNLEDGSKSIVTTTYDTDLQILQISNNKVYFYSKDLYTKKGKICSVSVRGKNHTEYNLDDEIEPKDIYVIGNKIYTQELSLESRAPMALNLETNQLEDIEKPSVGGDIKCRGNYVYGFSWANDQYGLYRISTEDISGKPTFITDKGTKIIAFTDTSVIVSDETETQSDTVSYFVVNLEDGDTQRYTYLFDAYKAAFGFSATDSAEISSIGTETNEFTIPDKLKELFYQSFSDVYANASPQFLFEEGASKCYYAPNSEETMYYFSEGDADNSRYLTAIEGPLNLLISGKSSATVSELKELFGNSFSFEYSEYMGGYVATASVGEYTIEFGTFASENDTVTAFRLSK